MTAGTPPKAQADQADQACQARMKAGAALPQNGKEILASGAKVSQDLWQIAVQAGRLSGGSRLEKNRQLTTSLDVAHCLSE